MSNTTIPSAPSTASVVPLHKGATLTLAQLRLAWARIAVDMLTQVVQELEGCAMPVRQAACHALTAAIELQGLLQEQ